jgi:hypothetical protein
MNASKPNATNLSETILVDGVERSRTNSEGKPIAKNDEELTAFWKWFADSKHVDEKGRPLTSGAWMERQEAQFDFDNPFEIKRPGTIAQKHALQGLLDDSTITDADGKRVRVALTEPVAPADKSRSMHSLASRISAHFTTDKNKTYTPKPR